MNVLKKIFKKHDKIDNLDFKTYFDKAPNGQNQLYIATNQDLIQATYFLNNIAYFPFFVLIVNDKGHTALHVAVLRNQPSIVRELIIAGADPAVKDYKGNTALHLACASGNLSCAKALTDVMNQAEQSQLKPGIMLPPLPQDLRLRNDNNEMCIHIAAEKGDLELVRYLVELGANLEACGGIYGNTALISAVENEDLDMVQMLLMKKKFDLEMRNLVGESAHMVALRNGDAEIAQKLLDYGAKLHEFFDSEDDEEDESSSMIEILDQSGITDLQAY